MKSSKNKEINTLVSLRFKEDNGNYYYDFAIPFYSGKLRYVSWQPETNLNKWCIIDKYGNDFKEFKSLNTMVSHFKKYMC